MSTTEDKQLYDVHQEQLINGHNNTSHTLSIVNIIGGIDKILNDYLSQTFVDNLILNQDALNQVRELLTRPSHLIPRKKSNKFNRHKTKTVLTDTINTNISRNYNEEEFCYSFYENDTVLYKSWFYKKNKKFVDIISNIFRSKLYLCIIGVTLLAYNTINRFKFSELGTLPHIIYSLSFTILFWIPYCIFTILSVNKIALKLIGGGFEFWFKIIVAICHFIAVWIDFYVLQYDEWKYPKLSIVERILFGISFILVVAVISLLDGLRIPRIAKIMLISIMALFTSVYSIQALILFSNKSNMQHWINYAIIQIMPNFAISLASVQISTMRILAIFLCRQAFFTYIRKENKGVMLRKSPRIIWNVEEEEKKKTNEYDTDNMTRNYDGNDGNGDDLDINTSKSIIAKHTLYTLHVQQINRGVNNDRHSKSIVDILGGIDRILSDYLNNSTINTQIDSLNDSQLLEIYEIIRPKLQNRAMTLTQIDQKIDNTEDIEIYYFFDENDTFFHYISNKRIADKIIYLFWSKIGKFLLCLSILIYIILLIVNEMGEEVVVLYHIINICIGFIIFVPYAIIFMLSCNKEAFIFSLKTFEFWLKTCYGIIYLVSSAIDEIYLNPQNYTDFGINIQLAVIEYISFSIWLILTIMCIAALDAIKLPRISKIIILSVCGIFGLIWSGFLAFIATSDEYRRDSSILVINNNFAISMLSLEISGARVVTIFICKQLFWTLRKKNKASMIKYIPQIRWYLNDNNKNNTNICKQIAIDTVSLATPNTPQPVTPNTLTTEMEQDSNNDVSVEMHNISSDNEESSESP